MALSNRAHDFLKKSKRDIFRLTEQDIRNCFTINNVPIFEPLIEFQVNFGGYIFKAGLEPIKFSLLKGIDGSPKANNSCIIEFEESDLTSPKYYFDCASTNYQMQFFLDEQGVYYEDYEPKASAFDKLVEHLALWNEINGKRNYNELYRNKRINTDSIDKLLNLALLPEASDQYTLWFKNEHMYMQQWQGLTTLIVSESYPAREQLLLL